MTEPRMAQVEYSFGAYPTGQSAKQDLKVLLCRLLGAAKYTLCFLLGFVPFSAMAIPGDFPITNTAVVDYRVGATAFSTSANVTLLTDSAAGNSPPSNVSLPAAAVAENNPGGVVGDLVVEDLDPADTHTFTVSDPRFQVVGTTLQLIPGTALDFEAITSIDLSVTATDPSGTSVTRQITIAVIDVNESPESIALDSTEFDANTPGAIVGALSTSDPDVGDTHTYTVDDPRFVISGNELQLAPGESLPLGSSISITVTSTDSGGLSVDQIFTLSAVPPGGGAGTTATISAVSLDPSGEPFVVTASQCDAGAGFVSAGSPVNASGQVVDLATPLNIAAADLAKSGASLFIRVDDVDANQDPTVLDAVDVLVASAAGDQERVRLFETAVNSGIFFGYVQTAQALAVPFDCTLQSAVNDPVTLTYTDPTDVTDVAVSSVLVDPLGVLFDSASGQPINGATVTLVNADGSLAQVFDDDAVSPYPSVVISGDGQGGTGAGEYRFPFVAPGDYQLQIQAPNRFRFPSAAADADLQLLAGAPYALSSASRGAVFNVPVGPAVRIDIPLDLLPVTPSDSELSLLAVDAVAGPDVVAGGQCFDGTAFAQPSMGTSLSLGPLGQAGSFTLTESNRYTRGDALVVRVVDPDQDLDPFAPDTVEVLVTVDGQSDRERLRLTETNDSTGVFTGFLQTDTAAASVFNCVLEAEANSTLNVNYQDAVDTADSAQTSALLDPAWTVIASDTGALLDGATITLIDNVTGLPATGAVFAADGVTTYPATVVSGGNVTDGAGRVVSFAPGTFLYPVITPGDYRIEVQPPVSYVFPSARSDAELALLPGGPFTLGPASRGEPFTVTAGDPVAFDVPLDTVSVAVFVSKQSNKDTAAIGDFVQYKVTVANNAGTDEVSAVELIDTLPAGFRLAPDSVRINQQVDASVPILSADGSVVRIPLGQLPPDTTVEVSYVVEVTAAAALGSARNQATVTGIGIAEANTAVADILVREDLFASKSFIVGQVLTGACEKGAERQGMAGVRVWLEDGSFSVTDDEGKYHFAGVEPGTHVVQMDTATLPQTHAPTACERNTEFAGSAISQFVDLAPGSLWRADFHVAKRPALGGEVVSQLQASADPDTRRVHYEYRIKIPAAPLDQLQATVMLDDGAKYVPGSSSVNGEDLADPRGVEMGALSYRLQPLSPAAKEATYRLRFAVDSDETDVIAAKAVVMFKADGQRHRSDVAEVEVGFNWPGSLVTVSENEDQGARTRVQLPSTGGARGASQTVRTPYEHAVEAVDTAPYQLPELDRGEPPAFDAAYIERHQNKRGIVFPTADYNPAMPAIPVAVLHASEYRPHLLVDGVLVNPLTFDSVQTHPELGLSLSIWDGVPISESDSLVEVQVTDRLGELMDSDEVEVHFSGAPVRAELVPEASYLRADGLHPPVVAVRFFDRSGHPLRAGATGDFIVSEPYRSLDQTRHLENLSNEFTNNRYRVRKDGIAYIQLEPTLVTGEVTIDFRFDAVREDTIRARIAPGQRDWILVGLAEGSFTDRDLSGNLAALEQADLSDSEDNDGRIAFYAKGMVRGSWLLTVAYDTDKAFTEELRRQIDPNQFYTLYGDGSDQLFDAQSQRKLYLKLERDRFQALFGDFDTAFSRSELARYQRRLNGLSTGYYGNKVEAQVFASETRQSFVRDEIFGDGTSGIYRLSQQRLVRNSEVVRVVTRDRFSPQDVLQTNTLTRFLDYTIDYDRGTLIFRQPVASQDAQFNPLVIEVEYEVERSDEREQVVGARVAYKLSGEDSELAVTYIKDDSITQGGNLVAADLSWNFTPRSGVVIEVAQSDTSAAGQGDAYLVEVSHNGEHLAGRAYIKEQDQNFGLGQQSVFELGMRKTGVEGELRLQDKWALTAQAYEQRLLNEDTERVVVDAQLERRGENLQWHTGLRTVQEETALREAETTQVLAGVTGNFMQRRLQLRTDVELDMSKGEAAADYPSRLLLGAEYKIFGDVAIVAEQEFSYSDLRDTQDTRLGLRAKPWSGADIHTLVQQQSGEDGDRLFATTGVMQQWRLNERWLFDVGMDRVQTLDQTGSLTPAAALFNPINPPASGSFDNDFTAYYVGAGYQHDAWNVAARAERHAGDATEKWNFLLGANRQLAEGRVVSASLVWLDDEPTGGGQNQLGDLRLGLAWRPDNSRFTWLSRMDWVEEKRLSGDFDTQTRKWINNTALNVQFNPRHQLSLHMGVKWTRDDIDGQSFDGMTGLLGTEYRFHFHPRWDIGLHASTLFSDNGGVARDTYGLSLGLNAFNNSWISVGYNWQGLNDDDFAAAEYTAEGFYLKFRLKFDQELAKRFLRPAESTREP